MLGNPRIQSALVSLLVCALSLHQMQGQGVATARISGTVTDDSGAVLVGATVQATHLETGSRRLAVTDAAGRFAIVSMLPAAVKIAKFVQNYIKHSPIV